MSGFQQVGLRLNVAEPVEIWDDLAIALDPDGYAEYENQQYEDALTRHVSNCRVVEYCKVCSEF